MKRTLAFLFIISLFAILPLVAQDVVVIPAADETEETSADGATGPVIWVHPEDSNLSLIIATDDNGALMVYDLDGTILETLEFGEVKNADLRYGFTLGDEEIDLLAVGINDANEFVLFTIDPDTRTLIELARIETTVPHTGLCMYHDLVADEFYVVMVSGDGDVEQYLITGTDTSEIEAELTREFSVGGESEGCVADDEFGNLFIGEEDVAIWRYSADPNGGDDREAVDFIGEHIDEQIEGLTLYYAADGQGYLIGSDEAGSSFVVYDRESGEFVGEFAIGEGDGIDALSEPGGMDVINWPVGDAYPMGLFVASDDVNEDGSNNNFKLVGWDTIAAALNLIVDTEFIPGE